MTPDRAFTAQPRDKQATKDQTCENCGGDLRTDTERSTGKHRDCREAAVNSDVADAVEDAVGE
jgi:transcription initiation factor IIE alpha subunit